MDLPSEGLPQELKNLEAELERAGTDLRGLDAQPGHWLTDIVLHRYLWGAISTASAVLALGKERATYGAEPLLRYLYETLLDVAFLLTSDERAKLAGRAHAWDLLEWNRLWGFYDAAVESLESPPVDVGGQSQSTDEAEQTLADALEAAGEDSRPFRQAYMKGKKQGQNRHWHWSGIGVTDRLNRLEERGALARDVIVFLRSLWPIHSEAAHPPVGLFRVKLDLSHEGTINVPDPNGPAPADEAVRVIRKARDYLHMIAGMISLDREKRA